MRRRAIRINSKAEKTILSLGFLVMAAMKYEMIIKAAAAIIIIRSMFIIPIPDAIPVVALVPAIIPVIIQHLAPVHSIRTIIIHSISQNVCSF